MSVGMAMGERWLAQHFQPAGPRDHRLRRLRPLQRRRHDGRRQQRSGLARGASHARQPLLDLRFQSGDDRGPYRTRLQRRCGGAVSRLWLECPARRRRQRHQEAGRGARSLQGFAGADADHRREPHRLRRAAQARHQRRSWRAARRRGSPSRQARLWLAGRLQLSRAGRRARPFSERRRAPRRRVAAELAGPHAGLSQKISRAGGASRPDAKGRASRGLGQRSAKLRARRQGARHPRTRRARR